MLATLKIFNIASKSQTVVMALSKISFQRSLSMEKFNTITCLTLGKLGPNFKEVLLTGAKRVLAPYI